MKIIIFIAFILCLIQCESRIDSVNKTPPDQENVNEKIISPRPTKSIEPYVKKDIKMDKESLIKRVEPIDKNVSRIIADPKSRLKMLNTPFLKEGKIYIVTKLVPTRRVEIFIGLVGSDFTKIIGGDEDAYFEFADKSGLNLNSSDLRLEYILNFIEITKSGSKRFLMLESIEDIKQRPNLTDEQKQQFVDFKEKYKSIITAPKQTGISEEYQIFLIIGQDLIKYEIKIAESNKIEKTETILEKNLLIPYAT